MFGKLASSGALVALLVSVGAAARPSSAATCPVTGLLRSQCCAGKASQMPPCCMKGCDTPGRLFR